MTTKRDLPGELSEGFDALTPFASSLRFEMAAVANAN